MNIEDSNQGSQEQVAPNQSLLPALPRAAELLFAKNLEEKKLYWDRSHYDSPESQMKALSKSSTLYIGNLSFSTRSCQVRSHFRSIGAVRAVHMGLDRFLKSPCGFCFVEYVRREDALQAVANLSGTKLDGKIIRVELDAGFQPGRQYGRGASGGQVRDDRRARSDPARKRQKLGSLNWTPPNQVQQEKKQAEGNASFYNSGDKREREGEDPTVGQSAEKNPRFRED